MIEGSFVGVHMQFRRKGCRLGHDTLHFHEHVIEKRYEACKVTTPDPMQSFRYQVRDTRKAISGLEMWLQLGDVWSLLNGPFQFSRWQTTAILHT